MLVATPRFGGQSMVLPLRSVLVRPPEPAFGAVDPLEWHYAARPDLPRAREEHAALEAILHAAGVQVLRFDEPLPGAADAVFTHDPSLLTDAGAILLRMGKRLRRAEPAATGRFLERIGVPILGRLDSPAHAEGGDLLWLDSATLAVGQGFRTDRHGFDALRTLLEPSGVSLLPVPLPDHRGPESCLHLMSLISLLDDDLAIAKRDLLPAVFVAELERRGIDLVEVAEDEFDTLGVNVLALGPRQVVALAGNPRTRRRLERAGCRVTVFEGRELCLKAEGGPTCLTRPLLRAP